MKINDLFEIAKAFRLFSYSIIATIRFVYYNFANRSIVRNNGYIYIYPHTNIYMSSGSKIILNGNFHIGIPAVKGSKTHSRVVMQKDSKIEVAHSMEVFEGCDIQIQHSGNLLVEQFHSNIGLEISCGSIIKIGKDVTAGRHVRLKDFNGHHVSYEGYPLKSPISIGNHVWICTGSTINPGVTVGDGAVISDNTNVIIDINPHTFNQGNPSCEKAVNITFKI